ncbi:MAG: hypothetical protein MK538_01180 [Planctomycetes bacterium]|nr:hypothetical protein [Planctomycetota bacterium]
MAPGVRALLISLVVVTVGLCAVFLEIERVRSGVRLRGLVLEEQTQREKLRRIRAEFVRACSPDLLAQELPPELWKSEETDE